VLRLRNSRVQEKLIAWSGLVVLLIFVFFPSFYLFSFVIRLWPSVYVEVFAHPILGDVYWKEMLRYLSLSLRLSLVTVVIDLLLGVPLAYLLVKRRFEFEGFLEDLTMLPLVIPTSGFGFATMLAWTASYSLPALFGIRIGLDTVVPVIKIPLLMLIVHVALTFPYVVKTVSGALRDLKASYEVISSSLGAHPLTTFRKVTLPLILPSMFSGAVLALARSLGETGATMIVAGVSTTAPIAIVRWEFENKVAPAAFLGALLVALSLIIIVPTEYLLTPGKKGRRLLPKGLEARLIRLERSTPRSFALLRDTASLAFLMVIVVLPMLMLIYNSALYWASDPYTGRREGSILYQLFGPPRYWDVIMRALTTSLITATLSTLLSVYISILALFLIMRYNIGRFIRILLKIPLVIPTSALGLSMILLWGPKGLHMLNPGLWLIVLTHVVFSVPVIVETSVASYMEASLPIYEDTARSLGATFYDVMETITLPMIKRGIVAGSLLAFTHSLGETGATFIVMGDHTTIAPLIVNMVESLAIPSAIFSSLILIVLSFIMLAIMRKIMG